ncbi:uncharacterized protein C16orf95 homolog isoform X2 [Mustela nigripes]|uniref:Uncharacterized protein C16orf95 homolog isoform X4 n=1 Tax=Mustela putorius furo TaxID=9669 RepID=A0A8U0UZB3_MUSPF|nr:uncharacterized protein C16orf95 homolog isoform X4 [Mustela putorius furo]XP_059239650.1 uncharacterized protein C16orf95 homolog isoform X2 [Mustela nigripes]
MGGPRERACLRARAGSCVLVRARAPLAGRSWTREGRLDCGHPPHDGHRSRVHGGPARVAAGTSGSPRVSVGLSARTAPRSGRESRPQTFGTEASPAQPSMCPVPSTVPRQPTCCECQARFGGFLPVPRVQAALPYWVPLSLRPRKQVLKRPRSCKGIQERPLDLHSWYNRWRICCDGRLLLKWQQLQAIYQHEPLAPERGVSPPAPFLPFSLLTLLQVVLKVVLAIRHLFWF